MAIKFTNVVVQGLLIASLALPSAALAHEQGSEELAPGFDACMGQATATVEMVNCLNSAYEYWDGILNRNYRQAIRDCADSGEPECKKKLQKAQRAWIQYKEGMADFIYSSTGGTMSSLNAASFLATETKKQAELLSGNMDE